MTADLDGFRDEVRTWCRENVPPGWRDAQTGVDDEGFVAFQRDWFQTLRAGGYAVPHWPAEWGGGLSTAEQVVLFQQLAAHDDHTRRYVEKVPNRYSAKVPGWVGPGCPFPDRATRPPGDRVARW